MPERPSDYRIRKTANALRVVAEESMLENPLAAAPLMTACDNLLWAIGDEPYFVKGIDQQNRELVDSNDEIDRERAEMN